MNPQSAQQVRARIESGLKKNGYSLTRQRRAIVEEILRGGAHFDVELLAEKTRAVHPSIGHATVYRTVKVLAGLGLIQKRMLGETRSHYEIVQRDHGHFICISCGKIVELWCHTLDDFLAKASKSHGFKVHRHSVELFGVCEQCKKKTVQATAVKTTRLLHEPVNTGG